MTATTYNLGSSPLVYAPGLVTWAIELARSDAAAATRIIAAGWGVPVAAARALVTGRVPFETIGDVVRFEHAPRPRKARPERDTARAEAEARYARAERRGELDLY